MPALALVTLLLFLILLQLFVDVAAPVVVVHIFDVCYEFFDAVSVDLVNQKPLKNGLFYVDFLGLLQELLVKLADPRLVLTDQGLVNFLLAGGDGCERLAVALDADFTGLVHYL